MRNIYIVKARELINRVTDKGESLSLRAIKTQAGKLSAADKAAMVNICSMAGIISSDTLNYHSEFSTAVNTTSLLPKSGLCKKRVRNTFSYHCTFRFSFITLRLLVI